MKKFKKLITTGLAAMMAVSAMSVTVMAKETVPLNNGVTLEIYNSAVDTIPDVPVATDIDNFNFNLTIPAYPKFVFVESTSGVRNMTLDKGQSVIQMSFDEIDRFKYYTLYDVTAGDYIAGSSTSMVKLSAFSNDVFRFTGLPGGHTYRVTLAHIWEVSGVQGSVISY